MEEYEYSFNVESIDPYITYCENNNYELECVVTQNRVVYENNDIDRLIARITTTESDNNIETLLDFKRVNSNDKSLKVSDESIPLIVDDNNRKQIESMLSVLGFFEKANNNRKRYVYQKDGAKFEIDNYRRPNKDVVAIEGERSIVDKVYLEITK